MRSTRFYSQATFNKNKLIFALDLGVNDFKFCVLGEKNNVILFFQDMIANQLVNYQIRQRFLHDKKKLNQYIYLSNTNNINLNNVDCYEMKYRVQYEIKEMTALFQYLLMKKIVVDEHSIIQHLKNKNLNIDAGIEMDGTGDDFVASEKFFAEIFAALKKPNVIQVGYSCNIL